MLLLYSAQLLTNYSLLVYLDTNANQIKYYNYFTSVFYTISTNQFSFSDNITSAFSFVDPFTANATYKMLCVYSKKKLFVKKLAVANSTLTLSANVYNFSTIANETITDVYQSFQYLYIALNTSRIMST